MNNYTFNQAETSKKKIHNLPLSDEKASTAVRRSTLTASKQQIQAPHQRLLHVKLCDRSRNSNSKQSSDRLADADDTAGRLVCTVGLVVERQGVCGGCKEDYEGPATRGLLLEPEKVCRKSGPHSTQTQNSHLSDK